MLSGLSVGHLLITLAVILLVFGTGKLRNAGSDIGAAIKQFKRSVSDDSNDAASPHTEAREQHEHKE